MEVKNLKKHGQWVSTTLFAQYPWLTLGERRCLLFWFYCATVKCKHLLTFSKKADNTFLTTRFSWRVQCTLWSCLLSKFWFHNKCWCYSGSLSQATTVSQRTNAVEAAQLFVVPCMSRIGYTCSWWQWRQSPLTTQTTLYWWQDIEIVKRRHVHFSYGCQWTVEDDGR